MAGPFSADIKAMKPDAVANDKWKPLSAEADGRIDLKATFATASTPAVYVRAYVFSPKAQTAVVAVESANPWRAWVNDVTIAEGALFEAELKQGWNAVLLKVVNGGKPATLGVRVTGDGVRTSAVPK